MCIFKVLRNHSNAETLAYGPLERAKLTKCQQITDKIFSKNNQCSYPKELNHGPFAGNHS